MSLTIEGTDDHSPRDLHWLRQQRNRKNRKQARIKMNKQKAERLQQEADAATTNQDSCTGRWNNLETYGDVVCRASQIKLFQKFGDKECFQCAECPVYDETCPVDPPEAQSPCSEANKTCKYCEDCGQGVPAATSGCKCVPKVGASGHSGEFEWQCWEATCESNQ